MAKVDGQLVYNTAENLDDDLFPDIPEGSLALADDKSTDGPNWNNEELHRLLKDALEAEESTGKRKDRNGDVKRQFDISTFLYVIGKVVAAQKTIVKENEVHGFNTEWSESDEASILAFPIWEISLRQWVSECLLQTDTVKAFEQTLVEKGATIIEPKIIHYVAQQGRLTGMGLEQNAKDKLEGENDDDLNLTFQSLDSERSALFTAAWRKAFPDYTIAGFPREVYRLLSLVNERVDAPGSLGARGTMPVSMVANGLLGLLAMGAVPTTGICVDGKQLDPMSEAVGRIIGAMEFLLKFGNQIDEVGGLAGMIGIAGPEELQRDMFWGESQACNIM